MNYLQMGNERMNEYVCMWRTNYVVLKRLTHKCKQYLNDTETANKISNMHSQRKQWQLFFFF